jgi:hypothetical protein
MPRSISEADARSALDTIDLRRRQVVAEIDIPAWYWWGLALGWIGLGILADVASPWVSLVVTVLFGAAHAAAAQRVLDGRHGSDQLRPHSDVVSRHLRRLVIAFLLVMVAATVGLALLADADGARHPATKSSVVVAIAVLCGGPRLVDITRRRAERAGV